MKNIVINTRKGYTVRANSGKVISRHTTRKAAEEAIKAYGATKCFLSYFAMKPIDYLFEEYLFGRECGMDAKTATTFAKCVVTSRA